MILDFSTQRRGVDGLFLPGFKCPLLHSRWHLITIMMLLTVMYFIGDDKFPTPAEYRLRRCEASVILPWQNSRGKHFRKKERKVYLGLWCCNSIAKPCGSEGLFALVKAPSSPLTLKESAVLPTFPIEMYEAFWFLLCMFKAKLELQNQSGFYILFISLKQLHSCFLWSD